MSYFFGPNSVSDFGPRFLRPYFGPKFLGPNFGSGFGLNFGLKFLGPGFWSRFCSDPHELCKENCPSLSKLYQRAENFEGQSILLKISRVIIMVFH